MQAIERNRYTIDRGETLVTKPIHVKVTTADDALAAIEAVKEDGVPREIERNGKVIAVVNPFVTEGLRPLDPSPEALERALATGGSWKGLGGEDLAERIHKWRKESPPSPSVEL
jgi:hypothetical protein